jgi:hypothetical protein
VKLPRIPKNRQKTKPIYDIISQTTTLLHCSACLPPLPINPPSDMGGGGCGRPRDIKVKYNFRTVPYILIPYHNRDRSTQRQNSRTNASPLVVTTHTQRHWTLHSYIYMPKKILLQTNVTLCYRCLQALSRPIMDQPDPSGKVARLGEKLPMATSGSSLGLAQSNRLSGLHSEFCSAFGNNSAGFY